MKTSTGCLIAVGVIAAILVFAGVGIYNGLVADREAVDSQWSQVENVYQRRADLIPNLVASVKGAASFEQTTLTQVVEARSRVSHVNAQVAGQVLDDPQKFAQFQQAQDQLSSALSRLLVVVERYPDLKAVQGFRDLMTALEGAENRIAVERRRFNEVAQAYNTHIKTFPAVLLAGAMGFQPRPYFQSQPGAETAPKVDFGTSGTPAPAAAPTPVTPR